MKHMKKLLAMVLVLCTVLSLSIPFAGAISIADGSRTASIGLAEVHNYLETTDGTRLRGRAFVYTTNDGLTGPAYCINHGLDWTGEALPITGKYNVPATAGAFANGYPQHSVETFLELYQASNPILAGLTEDEYGYATQVAVWATLGQLAIDGTDFTEGRERIAQPVGDVQQMRVFRAVQLILTAAGWWRGMGHIYETGMYIRIEDNTLGGNTSVAEDMTLDFAANENRFGIKREVINGKSYFTKEYIVASATSTYYQDYTMDVWAENAPDGTIFTDLSNVELPRSKWHETDTWRTPVTARDLPGINSNDMEFYGLVKMCIPVDTATPSGNITIQCAALVMQYEIFLAENSDYTEQSYIIADPSKGTQQANAYLKWGGPITEQGYLHIVKVGGSGSPLPGATFTLTGTDGTSRTGTTDGNGEIMWGELNPAVTYTLAETNAPAGYAIAASQTIRVTAANTTEVVVRDDPLRTLTVKKTDKQNGYSLQGVTICFEQVDGTYKTTAVTDHAGLIVFNADKLPLGTYKVYEVATKPGYVLDATPQVVNWDGSKDVTLTFENVRKPTLIISKKDSYTHYNLPGATFAVYKNGQLAATVTTDENGLAYATDLTPGYYEVKETVAPAGYTLNTETYGINIDPYDPATSVDPRLVVENDPLPSLRIVKYDRTTLTPMPGTSFKVYRDNALLGTYITNVKGEIVLTGVEPGTYTVEEQAADNSHIVNSTPQTVELRDGNPETITLAFYNDRKPGMHLVKVDANDPNMVIAGAVFEIKAVNGSFGPTEFTTDRNGEIDLSHLATGAYVVTEKSCPGYTVDNAQRIVELKANEDAEFVFTDSKLPKLTLRKQDAAGKAMEGVIYSLTPMGEGAHSDERTTNAQGEIVWEGLQPGLYSLKEVATLSTHVIDPVEHHVELYPGKDGNLLFINQEKPSLRITKYDRTSHAAMKGVTFEIWKDTVSLGKYTTNADGEIFLEHIEPGTYKAAEVDTGDDGHILATTPQEVELVAGGGVRELVFFNDRLPGLRLVKVDSADLETPIANAKFRFTAINGSYGPVELTTGEDGTIDLTKLPVAAYEVVELACPGYVVDKAQRLIQLDGNETGQFVFTNTKLPVFVLTKQGADSKPLAGVTFRIAYVKDGTHYMDKTTDANGQIILEGLQPGVLSVRETATLPNYILDTREHHVELKAGQTATLNLKNDRRPNLTIHKADADTDAAIPGTTFLVKYADGSSYAEVTTGQDGSVTLYNMTPGTYEISEKAVPAPYLMDAPAQLVTLYANTDRDVYFRNHAKPGLTINKVDSVTGDPIQGVKFNVTYASNNTSTGEINDLGTYITDENGQIHLERLKDGWYKVTELEPKAGYAIKDPAMQECYIKSGTSKVLTFENTPLSALVVFKYDSVTGAAVKNAVFQVKYLAGESGTGGTVIGTYKTSANGSFTVTGLKAGTYVVEELASDDGHVIDTAPQTALLSGKEQDVVQLYFGNAPKASLTVKKIDAVSRTPLSDVEFLVTLADGSLVGSANGKFTTDSAGSFTISGLNPGTTLVVKETRAKDGYVLDSAAQTIMVKAGQAATLEFRNSPKGSLVILKKDSVTGEALEGVTFKVTLADGSYVPNADGKISSNGLYTTDKNGKITITGVSGTLVVTEVAAKPGYIIDPNTQTQTVVVNPNDTQTLTFYNTPKTTLYIYKYIEGTKNTPLAGVTFQVTDSSGAVVGPNNGRYVTDKNGRIAITGLTPGTTITARETKTVSGYLLDGTPQSILIKEGSVQTLTFWNQPIGGLEITKVSSADRTERIANVTFEVYKIGGAYVSSITTDRYGRASIDLEDGAYYAVEVKCPSSYKLDSAPIYFNVEKGQTVSKTVTNDPLGGIIIHKTDAFTGKGIYGVKFVLYDSSQKPIGEYTSDQDGYVYIRNLTVDAEQKFILRELEAAPGYTLDAQYKTVYLAAGQTKTVEWENTPVTGQIQVYKYAAENNAVTGTPAGTPLQGAVYEISEVRSGSVVGYITTDAHGIAASQPLPLGRYRVKEVTAPAYWQLDATVFDETLEYAGQIIKLAAYDRPVSLGVSITKRSNAEVLAGSQMRYDITVANTSNVPLESFFWHDRIPTDAATAATLTTGTYNARLNYRILYKTNYTADYQVLASNLLTSNNYAFALNAIPTQAGEVVTDVYFDFGTVPVGFQSVSGPTLTVQVKGTAANGYQLVNRADAGGAYCGTWQTAQANWTTIVRKLGTTPSLPKTGY